MDPVTHAVIGVSVSKITGNGIDLSNAATMGIVIGSIFPDIDILLQKWGDYVYLKNHRSATHSIPGIIISSIFISGVLSLVFQDSNLLSLFLWSMLGCFSHTAFDIFNTFGAKLLWPFYNKKFAANLLVVFDPIFLGILLGYIFSSGSTSHFYLLGFACYITTRVIMRKFIRSQLKRKFGSELDKINILPSLKGVFKWHFIVESAKSNVVGEKSVLKRGIRVIEEFQKLQDEVIEKALYSPVGKFFKDFTPLFHVDCEKREKSRKYIFTDMRYYLKNDFVHHAVLELDENDCIIKSSFNPYNMTRSTEMPANEYKPRNRFFSKFVNV